MKKMIMLFFAVSAFGIMLIYGCTVEEVTGINDCDEYVINPEDRTFNFSGIVKNADDTPYVGPLEVVMYKVYCEGNENGRKTLDLNTNTDGAWASNWNQTYTYKNEFDEVELLIFTGGVEHVLIDEYLWLWADVDTEFPNGFVRFTAESKIGAND